MSPRKDLLRLVLSSALMSGFFLANDLLAAETNFYTLQERWNKQQLESKMGREDAVDDGFSTALLTRGASQTGAPSVITLHRTLQEITSSNVPVELQLTQVLVIESIGSLVKFVSTDVGIVELESVDTGTIRLTATGIGTTFVHIWNGAGRSTFAVNVLVPKYSTSAYQIQKTEELEKSRPFHLTYSGARNASYAGEKYRLMRRSSRNFIQDFGLNGDSPYGTLEAAAQTEYSGGKTLLGGANIALKDGKVGNLKNFNAIAGDSSVNADLMVFPSGRIRGGQVEHWDDVKRVKWTSFYGRENQGSFGSLSTGAAVKRTLNSYLTGGYMDFKVNEDAKMRAGYFQGSGQSRKEELNKRGMGVKSEIKLGDFSTYNLEENFDNEHSARRHSLSTQLGKVKVKNEFRDISKKFFTMTGTPSRQGEVGYLADMTFQPNDKWSYSGSYDIFRDRIIFNPEDPGRYNRHADFSTYWVPCDDININFSFQDMDDTGRSGPSRLRTYSLQYNEIVDFWGKSGTFFTRYQHRASHFLTNSLSDYRNNQTTVGFYTPLFWGINFSVQKEWNALEEVEIGQYTHPNAVTYNWDTSRQLGNTPFFMDARLRIRDEEDTESTTSFMQGEDSTEVSGGLHYREYDNMDIFLTGSFTQYVPESLNVQSQRVVAEFYTGMRYDLDTGFRWQPVGSFEGYAFKDQNGDGVRQPYEPGIPGLKISSGKEESISDKDGHYSLKSVTGKKAVLTLDATGLPEGFVPTNSTEQTIDIVQNKSRRVDFGFIPQSQIKGLVFSDLNGDGFYDAQDLGLGRVKITLETNAVARTSEKGVYSFAKIAAGEHTISLDIASLPEGYLPVEVPKKSFTLHEGMRYEFNIPVRAKRTISGRVYDDANANKRWDANEKPLSGVRVRLDGQSVSSDQAGYYLFDDLLPGKPEISVDSSTLPQGYNLPTPMTVDLPKEPVTRSDLHIGLQKGFSETVPETEANRYDL